MESAGIIVFTLFVALGEIAAADIVAVVTIKIERIIPKTFFI